LLSNESDIVKELIDCQGKPVDIGGYYYPNDLLADDAMRPSDKFNTTLK
jgi:isocitrate dehydrogenase